MRLDDAKAWRRRRLTQAEDGHLVSNPGPTVRESWLAILEGMQNGSVLTQAAKRYVDELAGQAGGGVSACGGGSPGSHRVA